MKTSRVTRAAARKELQRESELPKQSSVLEVIVTPNHAGPNEMSPDVPAASTSSQLNSADRSPFDQVIQTPHQDAFNKTNTFAGQSSLYASRFEADAAEARRAIIRAHQATRYSHLVGSAEPNLSDPQDVRHFEVDAQGSLTFILLDNGEAWRLTELPVESATIPMAQMIAGKYYKVHRVDGLPKSSWCDMDASGEDFIRRSEDQLNHK